MAAEIGREAAAAPSSSRRVLATLLRRLCMKVGAQHYLLARVDFSSGHERARIVACDWVHDAVEEFGPDGVAKLSAWAHARSPGTMPFSFAPDALDSLDARERAALTHYGHGEIHCHRVGDAGRRLVVLFSSPAPGMIRREALPAALIELSYAIAMHEPAGDAASSGQGLTERERECLFWVSEGKTAEEVALILGVSGNTVNSYVAHAIRKCGASNRAMAIATAIRTGII